MTDPSGGSAGFGLDERLGCDRSRGDRDLRGFLRARGAGTARCLTLLRAALRWVTAGGIVGVPLGPVLSRRLKQGRFLPRKRRLVLLLAWLLAWLHA